MEKIIEKLKEHYGTYREMAIALDITEATIHNVKNGKGGRFLNYWLTEKAKELGLIK